MSLPNHEEPEVNPRSRPLCHPNIAVPIKKRRFMLDTSSSSPSHSDCSSPVTCDVSRNSSDPEPLVSVSCNLPASGTALTSNCSCEPRSESIVKRELNVAPVHEGFPILGHEEPHPNMASKETSNKKGSTADMILESMPIAGSFQPQSTKEPLELTLKEANMEAKSLLRDLSAFSVASGNTEHQLASKEQFVLPKDSGNGGGCNVKQEKLDSCSWNLPLIETQQNLQSKYGNAEPKADSAQLDRLNWDLNTTMDTWQESFDSAVHNEISGPSKSDVGVGFGPAEILCKEVVGTGTTSKNCVLEESDHFRMPSNSSKLINEGSNSEAFLDLQLKPSSVSESLFQWGYTCPLAKPDSMSELPLLSLAMKPLSSSCNPALASCSSVKAEPYEEYGGQKDSRNIEVDSPKPVGLKHVKSEPCEGQETSIRGPSDLKLACRAVKSEPLEDKSGGLPRMQGTRISTPKNMETTSGVDGLFMNTVPFLVRNGGMQQNSLDIPNLELPLVPSQTLVEAPGLVDHDSNSHITDNQDSNPHTTDNRVLKPHSTDNQDPKPHAYNQNSKPHTTETDCHGKLPVSTAMPEYGSLIPLDSVQESLFPDENLRLSEEACKMISLLSASLSESLTPDVKDQIASNINSYTLSEVTSADEAHTDSFGKTEVAESSAGKVELSGEFPDKSCKREMVPKNSCITAGAVVTVQKQRDDDDIEDGEVRDLALQSRAENSSVKREENQVKVVDSFSPVDVPLELASHKDPLEGKMESSDGLKFPDAINCNDSQCNPNNDIGNSNTLNLPEPAVDAMLDASSDIKKIGKTTRKITRNHLNDNLPEQNSKADILGARTVTEEIHNKVGNLQENSRGSDPALAKVSVSSKTELFIRDSILKRAKDKGVHSRIVNLNSAPDRSTSDKVKSNPGRTISLRSKKESLTERPLSHEKLRARRMRDEKSKYMSQIFERERSKEQTAGICESDSLHIRSRGNDNLKVLHGDRDSGREHVMEQVDSSTVSRFPRARNASEFAGATTGRVTRKLVDNELGNLSHMSCRRRSPREGAQVQVGMQMGRQPSRDISPSNYTGRDVSDVPDFVVRAREERLLRTLPDGRIAPPLFAYTRYARGEGSLVRRERSLSPIQRRVPLQFPPISSGSSPRSEARSHHQWSPRRRSPDDFDGSRELVSCRSPRGIRPDRMRSPPRRPCFAEDMVGRRHGSPPFAVDICPSRESDFQRPVRGLQRNIRRFNREISEEYFGSFPHNQFGENTGDGECVDRSCSERLMLSRSFRQRRRSLTDDDNENFRAHVDGGSSGSFRYCPERNEGFPERGSPRDFDGHIRNRLGNRLRGMEQEEDNRYHGDPGWQDTGISDVRLKRRRLQRQ